MQLSTVILTARRPCRRDDRASQQRSLGLLPFAAPPRARVPGGILRVLSTASAALTFSSEANDDGARFIGPNEPLACAGGADRRKLPLNKHRSSDQQRKKDRQQYRRHQPLANAKFGDI